MGTITSQPYTSPSPHQNTVNIIQKDAPPEVQVEVEQLSGTYRCDSAASGNDNEPTTGSGMVENVHTKTTAQSSVQENSSDTSF